MDEQAQRELLAEVQHDREDAGFELVAVLVIALLMAVAFALL